MTQVPPDAALLAASIRYLEAELLPTLAGEQRFKTRLAINALRILQRSAASPEVARSEASLDASLDASQSLALRIRQRAVALHDPQLLQQIESGLRQALEVNNPKWLGE
jgi:Domain of unknown function (DUF6285)